MDGDHLMPVRELVWALPVEAGVGSETAGLSLGTHPARLVSPLLPPGKCWDTSKGCLDEEFQGVPILSFSAELVSPFLTSLKVPLNTGHLWGLHVTHGLAPSECVS